jgi:predicted nucleic acid-binding protein
MSDIKHWIIYFDASALVKRYSEEIGSNLVDDVFSHLNPSQLTCSSLGILEVVSVLVRKRNDSRLSKRSFQQAMIEFKSEIIDREEFSPVPVDDALLLAALELIAKHNLNATDAVILRSALNLQQASSEAETQVMLRTADKRLVRAAQLEDIVVIDPEVETKDRLHHLLGISENQS